MIGSQLLIVVLAFFAPFAVKAQDPPPPSAPPVPLAIFFMFSNFGFSPPMIVSEVFVVAGPRALVAHRG